MKKQSFVKSGMFAKVVAFLLMLVMLTGVFAVTASAESIQTTAYDTYTYWTAPGVKLPVSSTPMYEYKATITGNSLGISDFASPADVITDKDGYIYVLDSGNGRIVVVNPNLTLNKIINGLTYNGEEIDFSGAKGLYVTEDKKIYIADTNNQRVIITNHSKKVLDILTLPEEDVIPETFIYSPVKVGVDSDGFTYILSEGSYYGALLYKPDGTFSGFFGANSVTSSILGVFEKIYDMIFVSDSKKENAEKTLPYSFTDITIDNENFVYTATGTASTLITNSGQLKKLSPGGTNVLKNKTKKNVTSAESTNFSDGLAVGYPANTGYYAYRVSDLAYMDVDKYGYMYGLCTTFGHIFIYDQECNLLTVFGGALNNGVQKGTFASAAAIQVNDVNQDILVVDSQNFSVTVFSETEYGNIVKTAQRLTNEGSYVESKSYWEKALACDRNQQLAYRGLAKAALLEEDYETTLEYAELGFDQDTYASAYVYVRNEYLTNNFIWIFGIAVVVIGALVAFLIYSNKHELKLIKNKKVSTMFECVFHPFQGSQSIRYYNNGSTKLATLLLFLYMLSGICYEMYAGFMYNMFNKSTYNALYTVLRSVGLVVLWAVVNWAMSTLFQGKGKMKHVYIVTCYALIPLIVNNILQTILTNVVTPEESLIISAINVVCLALAGIMLCVGIMTVHEFGFFKFLIMTVIVIFGMLVSVFVILMVFVLVQQMINFIGSVIKEIQYR